MFSATVHRDDRDQREQWWFEGAKNVSWPWLFPLRGWGGLTKAFTDKFVYMTHHFILLRLNDLRDGGLSTVSYFRVCLSAEGAKKVSWPWLLSPLR